MTQIIIDEELGQMPLQKLQQGNGETLGFLSGKKYCISDLEYIVRYSGVRKLNILKTQRLTKKFCEEYILNEDYNIFESDDVGKHEIIHYQPHLKDSFN
tara:strand:- start:35 stop:331 length:297 start_codon:yes stop_codon:yes gene_type:complete